MSKEARLFPGQPATTQRFEYGWELAAGQRWDAEEAGYEVQLTGLRFAPTRTIELDLTVDVGDLLRFAFREVAEVQINGSFDLGTTARGWEVMGTSMVVAGHPRADGRLVYVLELSNALVCIVSLPATCSVL